MCARISAPISSGHLRSSEERPIRVFTQQLCRSFTSFNVTSGSRVQPILKVGWSRASGSAPEAHGSCTSFVGAVAENIGFSPLQKTRRNNYLNLDQLLIIDLLQREAFGEERATVSI